MSMGVVLGGEDCKTSSVIGGVVAAFLCLFFGLVLAWPANLV